MVARFWLVTSLLVISASTAVAQSKTALQLCAARDVEVVILIEDHGFIRMPGLVAEADHAIGEIAAAIGAL